MSNEFQNSKIQILQKIEFAACQPDINHTDSIYYDKDGIQEVVELINNLQHPAPPKCSSCKCFGEWRKNSNINCRRLHLFVDTTFGCNRHSDYDKDGEV